MGAWGFEPWDSDEAADWFGEFMEHVDTKFIIQTVAEIEDAEDDYDRIRAVAYIVETLGRPYIWPVEYYDELDQVLEKLINLLQSMLQSDSDFLDMWDYSPEVVVAVEKQLDALTALKNK